jgi:acyl-CoA synthetase (AMP-forming)/AMP-acid ligase II/pimeloyl-ACP methyl ester carboxylesterase
LSAPALPSADELRRWGVDPGWSQLISVNSGNGATATWHVLDRSPVRPVATLVCVHGNPTWSYLWHHLVARLGDRYRVIAVDQLGMGFSDRGPQRRYAERVADLADVIAALHIEGPIIAVGHDWGGAISLGWAVGEQARRADLAGIVLCNTGIAVPAGRSAPRLIRLAATGPITSLVGHRTRIFVDGTIGLSFKRLPRPVREALRAPYRHAAGRRAIAHFVDDVPFTASHPSAAAINDVAERVRSLTAPTLLTWGANDPVFDDSFALDLAERIPHADRHRFPISGHLSPLESDVAGVVDAWLADQFGRRPAAPPGKARVAAGPPSYTPGWAAIEARANHPETAFVDGKSGARISFAELHHRVMGAAAGLGALGVQPGQRIALLVPPGIDLVTAVYACWRAGAVTVIADRGLGLRGLGRAVRGAHVDWVIGPPRALAAARSLRWAPRARTIAVGRRRALGAVACLHELASSTASLPPPPDPDDLAAVLYTSGATGPAKGVRYRHRQLAAQRDALASTYGITADDRLVAAFAPFALYGPALGITSTIPAVDVTKPGTLTAEALIAACAAVDATIVFAAPAALANATRTATTAADPWLARVRLVLSAGAPVPIATLRATARLCPAAELHTPYGMTECLPVADSSLVEIDVAGPGRGVCVGRPVPGVDVRVVPLGFDAGVVVAAVGAAVTGEVLVRAPWLSDGYDQLWRTERDGRPVDATSATWHRSGDVGHLDADGRLWIEGRSVHVIHAVAGPITPVPVEVAVERLDAVERVAAVGVGPVGCQQLVVVIEDREAADGLASDALAGRVRAAVEHPVAAVLTLGALPVDIRHNTKIDRTAVAEWASAVLSGSKARRKW